MEGGNGQMRLCGEVLSNGDNFAQGWLTSLYKVQKS